MASELQRLVDAVGGRLRRSVTIDDRNIRLLAYNFHPGEVDAARVQSIMQREVPKELVDYLHSLGLYQQRGPFTVPVRADLGITLERIALPIRHQGALLGFLWLLGSDGPLTAAETDAVRAAADQAAHILQRDQLLDELRQGRIREYLRDLLSGDAGLHADAAQRLIEDEILTAGPVTALVVTLLPNDDQPLGEQDRLALALALEHGCHHASPRAAIHLERADHGVLVLARPAFSSRHELDTLAGVVQRRIGQETGRPAPDCHVGIGEPRPTLAQAHDSYLEARRAAHVARVVGVLGAVVHHDSLGVYGLLAELPQDRLRRSIHPGLRRLLDHDTDPRTLTQTLDAYLTNAGDVTRTAAQLSIHRASVHYRLRRIQEITKLDLSNGDNRLALHLGLKVAHLIDR